MKSTFFTLFSVLSYVSAKHYVSAKNYVSSKQFNKNLHLKKDLKVEGNTEFQGSVSLEGPVNITGKVQFGNSSVDALTLLNIIQERLNEIENIFVHNDDGSLDLIPDVNFRGNVQFLGDSESQESTQAPTDESTQAPTEEATQEATQEPIQFQGPPGCEFCQNAACVETCLEQQAGQDILEDFDF